MLRTFRVLLIDDDPSVQLVMNAALQNAGHEVVTVGTRDDAIAKLSAAHHFQVILLDLRLGCDRGEEIFLRLIAASIAYPPVIIVSAQPQSEIDRSAGLIKAAGAVQKPTTIEEINRAMDLAVC